MITLHKTDSCRLTPYAKGVMDALNSKVRLGKSILEAGKELGLSQPSTYRYYYGFHALNESNYPRFNGTTIGTPQTRKRRGCYNRVRVGASCPVGGY